LRSLIIHRFNNLCRTWMWKTFVDQYWSFYWNFIQVSITNTSKRLVAWRHLAEFSLDRYLASSRSLSYPARRSTPKLCTATCASHETCWCGMQPSFEGSLVCGEPHKSLLPLLLRFLLYRKQALFVTRVTYTCLTPEIEDFSAYNAR